MSQESFTKEVVTFELGIRSMSRSVPGSEQVDGQSKVGMYKMYLGHNR